MRRLFAVFVLILLALSFVQVGVEVVLADDVRGGVVPVDDVGGDDPADDEVGDDAESGSGLGRTLLPIAPSGEGVQYDGVDITTIIAVPDGEEVNLGGAEGVVNVLKLGIFGTAKRVLAPVLVFVIAGFGLQLIFSGGSEETLSKAGKSFLFVLIGAAFVFLADSLSTMLSIYTSDGGSAFSPDAAGIGATTSAFTRQIQVIVSFSRYVLSGIALFYIVKSGAVIIFASSDEETVNKEKEIFIYGFAGFVLVMGAHVLIDTIFFTVPTGPDADFTQPLETVVQVSTGIQLITNLTNMLLASMSGLFLFGLVVGGALYSLSAGNEERGKQATKLIYGSLIGLVIAFSSFTIVSEFSSGGYEVQYVDVDVAPLTPP